MLKKLFFLARHRAPLKQYYLEIGVHLLKKGCNVEIGQVLKVRDIRPGLQQAQAVTEIYYSFHDNKISHKTGWRSLRK